jgi:hypothetical protein
MEEKPLHPLERIARVVSDVFAALITVAVVANLLLVAYYWLRFDLGTALGISAGGSFLTVVFLAPLSLFVLVEALGSRAERSVRVFKLVVFFAWALHIGPAYYHLSLPS